MFSSEVSRKFIMGLRDSKVNKLDGINMAESLYIIGVGESGHHYTQFRQLKGAFLYIF